MEYAKALTAAIMAILVIIEQHFGASLNIPEWLADLIAVICAILVWLVPNRAASVH